MEKSLPIDLTLNLSIEDLLDAITYKMEDEDVIELVKEIDLISDWDVTIKLHHYFMDRAAQFQRMVEEE